MDDEIEYKEIIAQYEVKNPSIDNTILEGINDIDWSKLNGMGDEADIPALLRATLSDRIIIREKAFEFLMEHIEHQGLVFEVTYYVVPFLINMLLHKQSPDRALIIVALWSVARDCEDVAAGSDDDEVYKRVYEEICKGFNFYISFLEHPDREVRQNIVYLLYCIRDHSKRILPILKDHLKIETDEEVREEMKHILMYPKR